MAQHDTSCLALGGCSACPLRLRHLPQRGRNVGGARRLPPCRGEGEGAARARFVMGLRRWSSLADRVNPQLPQHWLCLWITGLNVVTTHLDRRILPMRMADAEEDVVLTTEQVEAALEEVEPSTHYPVGGIAQLVECANVELRTWGHGEHQITLERVMPFFGDPRVLNWAFWCETCHVSQLALLARPADL